jgi:hypothetical protein
MSKTSPPLATAAVTTFSPLGLFHQNALTLLDGIAVQNQTDVSMAERFATFVGSTFIPPKHRVTVIESLERLRTRIVRAQRIAQNEVTVVAPALIAIDKAMDAIRDQPDTMPSMGNGHDHTAGSYASTEQVIAESSNEKPPRAGVHG